MKNQSRQTSRVHRVRPGRFSGYGPFSYWACEKSDGIRVLLFTTTHGDVRGVFLVRAASFLDFHQFLNGYSYPKLDQLSLRYYGD